MRRLALLLALIVAGACSTPPAPVVEGAGGLWQDAGIFTFVERALAGARSRVLVEMYEFGRTDLAAQLVEAHARGADVRLVLDPTVAETVVTARRLLAAGVSVRFYPVDDRAQQIDHVKLLLADREALVGGMNWGSASVRNHDYALAVGDAAGVARLESIFEQDWSLAGGVPRPLAPAAGPVAQTAPGSEIRRLLDHTLAAARSGIAAEVFDLTDPDLILLLELAHRSGLRVRVLLDPAQDVNRAAYAELGRAGVGVRWYRPPPGAKLHAKAVLADGVLVLGSANWSVHGLDVNHELDLATTDNHAVAAFATRFDIDWSGAA